MVRITEDEMYLFSEVKNVSSKSSTNGTALSFNSGEQWVNLRNMKRRGWNYASGKRDWKSHGYSGRLKIAFCDSREYYNQQTDQQDTMPSVLCVWFSSVCTNWLYSFSTCSLDSSLAERNTMRH